MPDRQHSRKMIKVLMKKRLLQRSIPGMMEVNHSPITLNISAAPDM